MKAVCTFAWMLLLLHGSCAGADLSAPARLDRDHLLTYRGTDGRPREVRSPADWERRRAEIVRGMESVMGRFPTRSRERPPAVRLIEEADAGDHLRRLIVYEADPGTPTPAYLLIPKTALTDSRRHRGVLCLHQTHSAGHKVVVGLGGSPNDEYGVELVRRGYVCLAPAYPHLANYAPDLASLGYASGTMKAIWDNVRGLDLLDSLPFVAPGRFGAIGHSLGGHNSVFTAVFDSRIGAVVSSCGLDAFEDYMGGDIRGWTSARYMPRLALYSMARIPFDFQEVIGALAPRSVFLSAPFGDTNFRWRSVDRIRAAAAPVYNLLGAAQHLRVVHPEAGHVFPAEIRQAAYQLFDEVLEP